MSGLLIALTVFLTITLALAAGIGLSYLAASGLVRAFAQRPRKPNAALTAVEAGSGGA